MVLHVIASMTVLSFFEPSSATVLVASIIGGGIGGSIGGGLAWFTPYDEFKSNLMFFALAAAGGIVGAVLGVVRARSTVYFAGPLGIPELANLLYGAMIGANLVPMCYWIYKQVKSGHIE